MQKIINVYHMIAEKNPNRIKTINGTQDIETIHNQIVEALKLRSL